MEIELRDLNRNNISNSKFYRDNISKTINNFNKKYHIENNITINNVNSYILKIHITNKFYLNYITYLIKILNESNNRKFNFILTGIKE